MTDHQKLLCTLLSEEDDRAHAEVPGTMSPMRVVSVLLVRRDLERLDPA